MSVEIVKTEIRYAGWTKLLVATVRTASGRCIRREIEDHGSAACVLPYDPERRTAVLVQQFRAPVFFSERQEQTLEAIAGIVEDPDPETTARREAMEEAGLRLDTLEYVTSGWTMPGISTERLHCYLAPYDERSWVSGGAGAESDEQVTPVEMALGELAGMADAGRLADVKSLLLLQTLRLRRPALFGR